MFAKTKSKARGRYQSSVDRKQMLREIQEQRGFDAAIAENLGHQIEAKVRKKRK